MRKIKDNIHSRAFINGIILSKDDKEVIYNNKEDSLIIRDKKPIKKFILKIPVLRGIYKTLNNFKLGEEGFKLTLQETGKSLSDLDSQIKTDKSDNLKKRNSVLIYISIFIGMLFSFILFIIIPSFLTRVLAQAVENTKILNLVEGLLRIISLRYVAKLGRFIPEIRNMYMYHAAEHKILNCLQANENPTIDDIQASSKFYWNCATTQFYKVAICMTILFSLIKNSEIFIISLFIRIMVLPLMIGILYEFKIIFDDKYVSIFDKFVQDAILVEPTDKILESVMKATNEFKEGVYTK